MENRYRRYLEEMPCCVTVRDPNLRTPFVIRTPKRRAVEPGPPEATGDGSACDACGGKQVFPG